LNIEQPVLERPSLREISWVSEYDNSLIVNTICRATALAHIQAIFTGVNVAIACIYCDYKNQAEQTVPGLIAGLLKQFVQDHPAVSDHVKSLYERHFVDSTRVTPEEVKTVLGLEIGMYSKVFIIVDGLDECLEGRQKALVTELKSLPSTVNLMVTSRPLQWIGCLFQHAKHLNISASDNDVRKYIEGRIQIEDRLSRIVVGNDGLTIANKIISSISGMCVTACQIFNEALIF
jgi:hypothetical protein